MSPAAAMLSALQRAACLCARSASALRLSPQRSFAVVTEPRAFAVVRVLGSQYKVVPSDKIVTSSMAGAIGQEVKLSDVLLVGSATATIIGTPLVEHSYVTAVVEEQTRADKVIVFKKKRRKNYRRRTAHRHGRDAVTAGGEKQGGEVEGSRAETPRVAEFIPTAVAGKAVFLGARLRSQSQRVAPGHTPGLPRNTVSYNANEKQRLKA